MKKVLVIGAGPAGLTAAYEILKRGRGQYSVTVLEESSDMGGISKTVNYKGNRMDMGGHRFFSKVKRVNEWWEKMLPMQGHPAYDDIVLGRKKPYSKGGPDPESEDRVMLNRNRISRIYFDSKFYDYPISLKKETFTNMGIKNTLEVGFSYLKACFFKREEKSLEDFYINRFGKKLYSMFFEHYTENLWGRHPRDIDPSWGAQRVKGLSIVAIIKDILSKMAPGRKPRHVETSLIESFSYPKLGPGQLWDVTAEEIRKMGGEILTQAKVSGIERDSTGKRIKGLKYICSDGERYLEGDYIISSMPLKDLVGGMDNVPRGIATIAAGLPYRDYMTLGLLVPKLNLANRTNIRTIADIVPDNWVYVHERSVKLGRFQIYNNWSPYLVKDLAHTVWIGLEYFVNEGDRLWNLSDEKFTRFAISEVLKMGLIDRAESVLDSHVERVKKAYPAYFDTYAEIDELTEYLNGIENLFCVGRNGQHRYNNIDHSMMTAFLTADYILGASIASGEGGSDIEKGHRNRGAKFDKRDIWKVNTEQEYHERNR
ncbi:MAG: NAD(P)/FAD-dependent oxidoreductase [Lachnospiraceae bacterium]|nr:NAD(P)/FAD-dependent oxidoreductase [Lachnospiraceae bacterium]